MSEELKDFRGKITPETHVILEALSRSSGKERQELVREVLHEWAMNRLHEHSLIDKLMRAEGLVGESKGTAGSRRALPRRSPARARTHAGRKG